MAEYNLIDSQLKYTGKGPLDYRAIPIEKVSDLPLVRFAYDGEPRIVLKDSEGNYNPTLYRCIRVDENNQPDINGTFKWVPEISGLELGLEDNILTLIWHGEVLSEVNLSGITIDTSMFVTSAYVQTSITERTKDFITSGYVEQKIDEKTVNFVTSGYVEDKITEHTKDFITSGYVEDRFAKQQDLTTLSGVVKDLKQKVDNLSGGTAEVLVDNKSIEKVEGALAVKIADKNNNAIKATDQGICIEISGDDVE